MASPTTPERERILGAAYHFLAYIRKRDDLPERKVLERMVPGMVDATLEHQLYNIERAMRDPDTPEARCAAGFFGSFQKEYE